jgi:hypothetical protein
VFLIFICQLFCVQAVCAVDAAALARLALAGSGCAGMWGVAVCVVYPCCLVEHDVVAVDYNVQKGCLLMASGEQGHKHDLFWLVCMQLSLPLQLLCILCADSRALLLLCSPAG